MHALLGPSGAHRWLHCPGSARIEETFPDSTNDAAEEGTLAHALGESLIKRDLLGMDEESNLQEIRKDKMWAPEMEEYMLGFVQFIRELMAEAKKGRTKPELMVEVRVDFSDVVPEGFGTSDIVVVAGSDLYVIDLKYGAYTFVEAHDNPQLKLYAYGTYAGLSDEKKKKIKNITMGIFQPRMNNVQTVTIPIASLLNYMHDVVAPGAKKAFEGVKEYIPGDHCKYCKAKAICKACVDKAREFCIERDPMHFYSISELAGFLTESKDYESWIKGLKEYLLQAAIEGKRIPGYVLGEGKKGRDYAEGLTISDIRDILDYEVAYEDIVDLKTPAQLEKVLTAPQKIKLSEVLIFKPGKPALVKNKEEVVKAFAGIELKK